MYKQVNHYGILGELLGISNTAVRLIDGASIPFDPANTDYANFKAQILADEAQLEDADGNLMSPEEAQAFVATLP